MAARVARWRARLGRHAPVIAIAAVAIGLAWTFAAGVLVHTRPFGLPLDDAYIYLTYARQLGRGEPFSYVAGGGYSGGLTSALWPIVLAPFWALGARGHALVWVSFGLCSALYAASCVACYRLARRIGGAVAGIVAAGLVVAVAPFAWTALSGMEVALTSALVLATLLLLARAPDGPPPRLLAVCLAATALARPEAAALVALIAVVAAADRLRRRSVRAAALWVLPLAAPAAWFAANRTLAGHWLPNTAVAKSHFYLPGFDASYWWTAVGREAAQLAAHLADPGSPLVWPRLVAVLWLVGAIRVLAWARREHRWLTGALVVAAPLALMLAAIASSPAWSLHNDRYIAPAFPLIMVTAGCAFAPTTWSERRFARPARIAAAVALVAAMWWGAVPALRADIALYAQNAADLDRQVIAIGRHVARKLPGATIMTHDAGALAYYSDRPIHDMLGLVTNHQADIANHGPGARFEFLERLPPDERPTHFAYYTGWMGQDEFFGELAIAAHLARPFSPRRSVGDYEMQLVAAVWDHAHTAERAFAPAPGWHLADRVDIADLADERAHDWHGALGRRALGDPTARWSVFHREVRATGLALDGGRTIRGGAERFTLAIAPGRPVRLVLRTGGHPRYPWNDDIAQPVRITASTTAGSAEATLAPPTGALVEIAFDLPVPDAPDITVRVAATGPYRAFHWFALQPD